MGRVEAAIRSHISPGQVLKTPDRYRSAEFEIGCIDTEGLVLLLGRKRTRTKLSWACLEGIPGFLSGRGWVRVGTVFDTVGIPGTLDSYLKGWTKRGTAGWVAAVLEEVGIVEVDRKRPLRVRLKG